MSFNPERYPQNWKEISDRIKTLAGWKCQNCGLPHGVKIARNQKDKSEFILWDEEREIFIDSWDGLPIQAPDSDYWDDYDTEKLTTVVLTTHHKGAPYPDGRPGDVHDKMDCRDENLERVMHFRDKKP